MHVGYGGGKHRCSPSGASDLGQGQTDGSTISRLTADVSICDKSYERRQPCALGACRDQTPGQQTQENLPQGRDDGSFSLLF